MNPLTKMLMAVVLCSPAAATEKNGALLELLKALNANGTIDDKTYGLIESLAEQETRDNSRQEVHLDEFKDEHSIEQIVNEKIALVKNELKPQVRLGGRIQVDSAAYQEDYATHNAGTELRRARMFAQGDLSKNWAFKLQYDFTATGNKGIQDAYLDYKGLDFFKLRLGHFKEPFSLQNITSSKNTLFSERGLPHVFAEGRNIGIQATHQGNNWTVAAGLFGDARDRASDDNEGWGFSGRGTFVPFADQRHFLHLGLSLSYRATGSENTIRFSERPESHITDTRIVETGAIDADRYFRSVFEAAYVNGPFNLQGEYYQTAIERILDSNPNLDFDGYYIEAGWFLTEDSMNYKSSGGNFSKINPKSVVGDGGLGAWQVAARFSNLDLNDGDINGGEAQSFTLGVNWYATAKIRFTLNYVDILEADGGPHPEDEPSLIQFRSQLAF